MDHSLDIKLISKIVEEQAYLRSIGMGMRADYIEGSEKHIWNFISEYYGQYKAVPSADLVNQKFDITLPTVSDSLEYWVGEAKKRALHRGLVTLSRNVDILMTNSKPDEAFTTIQSFVRKTIEERSGGASLKSMADLKEALKQRYLDAKMGKTGILTPWRTMNEWTMGWWPGDVSWIIARLGLGKCLAPGTKVVMADGSVRKIEDVSIGESVMGPDSRPREVLDIGLGREEMFEVIPVKGERWTCNRSHILSLKCSGNKDKFHRHGGVYYYTVDEYLQLPKRLRDSLKLWRVGVDFPDTEVPFDPRWVGLWLGDGTWCSPEITTKDEPELISYYEDFAKKNKCVVSRRVWGGRCPVYTFTGFRNREDGNHRRAKLLAGEKRMGHNPIREFIGSMIIDGEKRIPRNYLVNSRAKRLALLAGIIDSDGHLINGVYEISTKYAGLKDDILFLARSLGFAATCRIKNSSIKSIGFSSEYWRIFISGETSEIPCLLPRKKAKKRRQKKNHLVTGFKLESKGDGDYVGFVLGGDHQYVLWDFTVTHNTWTICNLAEKAREQGKKILMISGEMSMEDLAMRQATLRYKFPYSAVRKARLSPEQERRYFECLDQLVDSKEFIFMDASHGFRSSDVEMAIDKSEPDIVLVDAAYRIKSNRRVKDRFENMADIADDTKTYALRYKVPVVCSSQLNRESTKKKTPGDDDVALSDVVGWNATNMFALRQEEEHRENRQMAIHPLKVREAENAREPMVVNWDFINMNFRELGDQQAGPLGDDPPPPTNLFGYKDEDDNF